MTIVDAKDFHPHTGAYWKGATDKMDGKPVSIPEEWGEHARLDYLEGYASETVLSDEEVEEACKILNAHRRMR